MKTLRTLAIAALLGASLASAGCAGSSSKDKVREALLDAGYSAITIDGYAWWGCGKDDDYGFRFSATGPTGRPVKGVACSSFFDTKGTTIRLTSR